MTESELVTELRAEIERRRLLANEDHETIATQAAEVERLRGEASQRDEMLAGAIRDYNALKEGFAPLQTILDMTEAATCEQVVSQAKLLVATKIRLRGESSAAEARATTAESSLETARGALEKAYWIAFNGNGSDAADCAVNIAKQIRALAALPSPPITIIKGEG